MSIDRIRVASKQQQEKVGDLAAAVERGISAIRTVRASNATERETVAVEEDARGAYRAGVKLAKISALVVPVAGIAMQVSFLVVLGVGGFRVASGELTVADLVAFILFLFLMIMPLGQAFGAINSVNQALGALGRIQEVIALPSEDEGDAALTPAADLADLTAAPAISFEEVRFRYPEQAHKSEREKAIAEVIGRAGRGWRSSGRRGRARARSSRSSSGSTTRPAVWCDSAASTCGRSTDSSCGRRSATWSRTRRCSPEACATTSRSPRRTPATMTASRCCAPSTWAKCSTATRRGWTRRSARTA